MQDREIHKTYDPFNGGKDRAMGEQDAVEVDSVEQRRCKWCRKRFPRAHFDEQGVHYDSDASADDREFFLEPHNYAGYRVYDYGTSAGLEVAAMSQDWGRFS